MPTSLVLTSSSRLRFGGFSLLYFAQGVPIGLFSIAIPAWLAERGASAGEVSVFLSIVTVPWACKLLAGPFMDRLSFLPMGYRRPWVMFAQAGLILSFVALAGVAAALGDAMAGDGVLTLAAAGFVVNVFAASQDVAVDGMAIDVLPTNERGRANAFMAFGQVAGYSLYGYLCAALLTRHGLPAAALCCGLTVGAIFAFATAVRERPGERVLPWTAGAAAERAVPPPKNLAEIGRDLLRVFLLPMSLLLVAVDFLNNVRVGISVAVFPTFAVDLGYTAEQYAAFNGWLGIGGALVGAAIGPFIDKLGAYRFLAGAFVTSAACHLLIGLAPEHAVNPTFIIALASVVQVATQVVFITMIALFMNMCWPKVAATQFAIYMSLANLSRTVGGFGFAAVSDKLSFAQDFIIMGVLLLAAAGSLCFFKPAKHAERLRKLGADA